MNICRHVDLEDTFGLNADIFSLSSNKRKEQIEAGLRPSWKHDEHFYYRRLEAERSPSPARRWVAAGWGATWEGSYCQCQVSQPVWSPAQETDKEFVEVSRHPLSVWTLRQVWWLRLDSVQYGLAGYLVRVWVCLMQINVGSDGTQITLSQSDKWLRQAKVIDGWSVTTTDTAIAFRWLLLSSTHWLSNAKLMNYIIIPFI